MDVIVAWAGSLASLVGLVVSCFVLFVSAGAKKAAERASEEVRASIEKRTLVDDLRAARDSLRHVAQFVGTRKWELAHHRASQALEEVTFVTTRWLDHLPKGASTDLTLLQSQLDELVLDLGHYPSAPPGAADLRQLSETLQDLVGLGTALIGSCERELASRNSRKD